MIMDKKNDPLRAPLEAPAGTPLDMPLETPLDAPLVKPCEVCGNKYDKAFEVIIDGETHVYDSFECAIHALAPVCKHCGCKIVGHGMESDEGYFCCAYCARVSGEGSMQDRA
jgi:hypothetical protein